MQTSTPTISYQPLLVSTDVPTSESLLVDTTSTGRDIVGITPQVEAAESHALQKNVAKREGQLCYRHDSAEFVHQTPALPNHSRLHPDGDPTI